MCISVLGKCKWEMSVKSLIGKCQIYILAFVCYKRFSPDDIIFFEFLGRFDKNQKRKTQ